MRRHLFSLLVTVCAAPAAAQALESPLRRSHAPRPTAAAISAADLTTRLYIFADDSMLGRFAGTEGNLKATDYIARELSRLGLTPAGDGGTYFQAVPLVRHTLSPSSRLLVDGHLLARDEWLARYQGVAEIPLEGLQVVHGGRLGDESSLIPGEAAAGKVVVLAPELDAAGRPLWSVARSQLLGRFASAAAVVVANLEHWPADAVAGTRLPYPELRAATPGQAGPVLLMVTGPTAARFFGQPLSALRGGALGGRLQGRIAFDETEMPARNVVALLPGTDPALRGQYVAIGAHSDHHGITRRPLDHDSVRAFNQVMRPQGANDPVRAPTPEQARRIRALRDSLRGHGPARLDSINNGADDDGSGSMAVLEIAEAFANPSARPRRSLLFVWHTGEEIGLLGSRYFTDHPAVSRDSVVAQLNVDMVGRGREEDIDGGGAGYLQLIGARRLSTGLGDLVETVNRAQPSPFTIDYTFDANGHPQNFYCRSDHYMYARYGIPIAFFSTGGHRDYHMVSDEPQYIDYDHLARVTHLIHDVAVAVGNGADRPRIDRPVPDRNLPCRQ